MLAIAVGALLKTGSVSWVVLVAVVLLVWIATTKRVSAWFPIVSTERGDDESDDLFVVRFRRPSVWDRRLRKTTEAFLNDWHHYQTSTTRVDPTNYDHAREMARRDGVEVALRGRVVQIERKYQRRKLLPDDEMTRFPERELPSDASIRTDHLGMAIRRLERLLGELASSS